jgi:hypothetical protein
MKAIDVQEFLDGSLEASKFQAGIADEIAIWMSRQSERGRSHPIILTGSMNGFEMTKRRALGFIEALIARQVSAETFAYVLNALLLEECLIWSKESIREALEALFDYDTGRLDARRAVSARREVAAA